MLKLYGYYLLKNRNITDYYWNLFCKDKLTRSENRNIDDIVSSLALTTKALTELTKQKEITESFYMFDILHTSRKINSLKFH